MKKAGIGILAVLVATIFVADLAAAVPLAGDNDQNVEASVKCACEILAPKDITGWTLTPGENIRTYTVDPNVQMSVCVRSNCGWWINVEDSSKQDGHMKGAAGALEYPLEINGQVLVNDCKPLLDKGGNKVTGGPTGPSMVCIPVDYNQKVAWNDPVGCSYTIVIDYYCMQGTPP